MSFPDTRDLQQRWLSPRPTIREVAVLTLILSLMGIVFVFDILTPPDDVTICFIYAVLVFLTLFSHGHAVYLCAAIATCLSVLGSFINPPTEAHSMVFFANRGIAIMAQWIVAFLVMTRKDAEMRMREDFDDQRLKAETSRRFLDVLSHEIGTSLTRIDGQAFLLRKNAQTQKPADTTTRAEKIRDAVQHILTIVQQIQLGSEAGERATDMTPSAVDLQGLIADIALNSGTDEVTIEIDLTELPPTVWGDSDMLRQVFDNILSNAVKYSPPGGAIRVHGAAEDRVAIVTVIDHGRGIPDDEQAQIFTPYYRARNSRGVHGAGIGLYVARRFVDSHGGSIVIDSRLNAGTTVVIRLPIEPVSSEELSVPIAHPLH
jgi:signal transduction histidine kinase